MFTKELSAQLIKIIDERELTVESLAVAAGLTREQLSNIKNGKAVPKLTSIEKLCTALEVDPNDLLLNEKSMQPKKAKAKQVNTMYSPQGTNGNTYIPVCPTCNSLLHSDWESYCGYCGQRLNWERYHTDSKVTYKKPVIKKEIRD